MYFAIQMPILTADTTKIWTADDYQLLSDDIRYEIINGNLFMTPAPSLFHQEISETLSNLLGNFLRTHKTGKLYCAPTDVYFDQHNVYQPDILILLSPKFGLRKENGIHGAPDLIVEILSPSNSFTDLYDKKEVYEIYGVKEYWIVDPGNKTLEVFWLNEKGKFELHIFASEDEQITSRLLNGLVFDLSIVWQM